MINTVLKFPYSKFRFNWTNISLFVPDFFAVKQVPRCPWLAAVFCQQSQLECRCGLSMTYHTEILQNKMMQTETELQHFNVHTLVTHLVNVFSLTQMYD